MKIAINQRRPRSSKPLNVAGMLFSNAGLSFVVGAPVLPVVLLNDMVCSIDKKCIDAKQLLRLEQTN